MLDHLINTKAKISKLRLICFVLTTFAFLTIETFAQESASNEFDCGAEYDPSIALNISAEYQAALKRRDYARLKELKTKREQLNLWQKNYTRNCGDDNGEVSSDDSEQGNDGGEQEDTGSESQPPQMCGVEGNTSTACDDGLYCTSASGLAPGPDSCVDGKCSGKPIGVREGVSLALDYDITALKEALAGGGGSAGLCSWSGISWSGGIKQNFVEGCCESKMSMVEGVSFDGTVSLSTGGVQCDIPAFHWGLAQVGVTAGASVGGSVTGSGIKLPCEESCGWKVGGKVGVELNGGIYVAVGSPNVLKVTGTLSGAGSIDVSKSCGPVEVQGCVGPPAVNGSVVLGGWYKKSVSYTFSDMVKCW